MAKEENQEILSAIKWQIISFAKTSWGRFLIGILTIFLVGRIGIWLATHDHLIIACFFAVIAGIISPFPVMSSNWKGGPLVLTIFITIFAGMIPCFTVRYGGNGNTVSGIRVVDAPNYTSETVFYFLDGKVMKDYLGYKPIMGRYGKVGDAYVAPIVPEDWTTSDPVPAWVYAEYNSPDAWDQEYRAGIREAYDDIKTDAVKDAEESYRIHSAENAPILMWTNHPEHELGFYKKITWFLFIFFSVAWSIVFWLGEFLPADLTKGKKK